MTQFNFFSSCALLGGPGSGKMTHAQNLADIHEGYRHINLTVVISEYIKENGEW